MKLNLRAKLSRFRRDERGAIFIILALSVPMIFGAAAISVDLGQLMYIQTELQTAADAAALAAAKAVDDETEAQSIAVTYAELNMPTAENGSVLNPDDVILGNWDEDTSDFTADGTPTNAIEVTVRRAETNDNAVPLFFARVIGFSTRDVEALAIAYVDTISGDTSYCMWSTEESDPSAFKVNGTVDLHLGDCGIAVSSTDETKAFEASGTVDVTVGSICVAGGATQSGSGTVDPGPTENCDEIPDDPLEGLATPTVGDCDFTDFKVSGSGGDETLSPGTYCNGIEVSGSDNTITFEEGVYILDGGGLKISGGGNTLQNETNSDIGGVIFYNTASDESSYGDIDFSGNSSGNLSAPTSGTYAGVLFFQDPSSSSADSGIKYKIAGTVDVQFDGVVYMPDHAIEYSGTSSQALSCTKLIGLTITFSGTTGVDAPDSCASDNIIISNTETFIRLAR